MFELVAIGKRINERLGREPGRSREPERTQQRNRLLHGDGVAGATMSVASYRRAEGGGVAAFGTTSTIDTVYFASLGGNLDARGATRIVRV